MCDKVLPITFQRTEPLLEIYVWKLTNRLSYQSTVHFTLGHLLGII